MKRIEKLNQQQALLQSSEKEVQELQVNYMTELETNPKYSLLVDPEDKYGFHQVTKDFIKYYIDFRNVLTAGEFAGLQAEDARSTFLRYDVQNEIRRINMALYQRQFANKLLNMDQIGGYLTSLLTGENVPLADQLKTNEKLRVVELLIKLNEMKRASLVNPVNILDVDINTEIKNLSLTTIKQMLANIPNKDNNKVIVNNLNVDNSLSLEEKAYLESLPTAELLKLVNDTNSTGGK